jgi:hypothetical protein
LFEKHQASDSGVSLEKKIPRVDHAEGRTAFFSHSRILVSIQKLKKEHKRFQKIKNCFPNLPLCACVLVICYPSLIL